MVFVFFWNSEDGSIEDFYLKGHRDAIYTKYVVCLPDTLQVGKLDST